jgi:hypothetical protein
MEDELITKYTPTAKQVGRAMAGVCHLSQQDAEQEALVGLINCVQRYAEQLNAGMVKIAVRNHLLHTQEKLTAKKRTGVTVHGGGDIYPSAELSPEQLAIAADGERRIGDACEALHMSPEQTLATIVALYTLSRSRYQEWIQSHPFEWSTWLSATDMSPKRAAEINPIEARKLFARLMTTLKDAR